MMLQSTYAPMLLPKETALARDSSGEKDFFSCDTWTTGFFDGADNPTVVLRDLAYFYVSNLSPSQLISFENVAETGRGTAARMLANVVCRHLSLGASPQWTVISEQEPQESSWVSLAYIERDELSFEEIRMIVDQISDALHHERYSEVDTSLANADPDQMSADAIVTIAHISIVAQDNLPSLESFISRSRASFNKRGMEDFLEGLA